MFFYSLIRDRGTLDVPETIDLLLCLLSYHGGFELNIFKVLVRLWRTPLYKNEKDTSNNVYKVKLKTENNFYWKWKCLAVNYNRLMRWDDMIADHHETLHTHIIRVMDKDIGYISFWKITNQTATILIYQSSQFRSHSLRINTNFWENNFDKSMF